MSREPIRYMLATCPACMKGAGQVLRGPPDAPDGSWLWCLWRLDGPDPLGWPARIRVCTKRTLPRWARKAIRGRGRATMLRFLGAPDTNEALLNEIAVLYGGPPQ